MAEPELLHRPPTSHIASVGSLCIRGSRGCAMNLESSCLSETIICLSIRWWTRIFHVAVATRPPWMKREDRRRGAEGDNGVTRFLASPSYQS